jgi:signal transduction histidine kinase
MSVLSSLTNRLFAAMALLALVSIAAATYYATRAVTAQAEGELRRDVDEAGTLVEEYRALIFEHFNREARLVADLPRLKAAVAENHAPTLAPIAEEYRTQLGADLLVVVNPQGAELARTGTEGASGILETVSAPIAIRSAGTEFLGTLKVGLSLDARAAARFKALTNSEIAFGRDGTIRVATLPEASWPLLAKLLATPGITTSVRIGDTDFIAATRVLRGHPSDGGPGPGAPVAIVMRSRTERLQFLSRVHATVLLMALGAVLLATLASYAIARTVTGPLGAVTAEMRNMAATGDLARRITLTSATRWEDEDAKLLATTFNSMTDAIARFQREAGQRERLSALGRLSTVVAHEIRNPLMIIKTTLRTLRRQEVATDEVQAAVADIDEEVTRLDHLVSEVLDFARPIRFELAPVDLNALCADAARAAWPGGELTGAAGLRLDLATDLPAVVTDAERLRLALVNVLTNARQAVAPRASEVPPPPARLSTCRLPGNRVEIDIRDYGIGIAAEDQARMFDPFFTTRRTGTGLGLAITRNIIEGLGGTITLSSRPGEGTEVHIELPVDRVDAGMHP